MARIRTHRRPGFTIVEFLAVAACVTVLSGLFLPAIQDARSAAQRSKCMNNLKYIALSLHNYHDVYNGFPPGWVNRSRDGESQPGFGWQARLLPYLEQAPLYTKLQIDHPLTEADGLLKEPVTIFLCPADSDAPQQNSFRDGYGMSSYSGSMGTITPPRWSDGRMETFWPGAVASFATKGNSSSEPSAIKPPEPASFLESVSNSPNGIFGLNSNYAMRDIVDGTSNTLAVGERSRVSGWGIWPGVGSNRFENDVMTDVSYYSPLNRSLSGYSSAHPGGLFVALCDGSVRFLSNDVNSSAEGGVLQNLGTRAGGEVISGDVFRE